MLAQIDIYLDRKLDANLEVLERVYLATLLREHTARLFSIQKSDIVIDWFVLGAGSDSRVRVNAVTPQHYWNNTAWYEAIGAMFQTAVRVHGTIGAVLGQEDVFIHTMMAQSIKFGVADLRRMTEVTN